jgi:cytoskeletal protein CcmA (bactofilin family)
MVATTSTSRVMPSVNVPDTPPPPTRPGRVAGTGGGTLVIGTEVHLNATIGGCAMIAVSGRLQSEQVSCETLNIAQGGSFSGSATVAKADISGSFQGRLIAAAVAIRGSAYVSADLEYDEIEIERGAKVSGALHARRAHEP